MCDRCEPGATQLWLYVGEQRIGARVLAVPLVAITDPQGVTMHEPSGPAQWVTVVAR